MHFVLEPGYCFYVRNDTGKTLVVKVSTDYICLRANHEDGTLVCFGEHTLSLHAVTPDFRCVEDKVLIQMFGFENRRDQYTFTPLAEEKIVIG